MATASLHLLSVTIPKKLTAQAHPAGTPLPRFQPPLGGAAAAAGASPCPPSGWAKTLQLRKSKIFSHQLIQHILRQVLTHSTLLRSTDLRHTDLFWVKLCCSFRAPSNSSVVPVWISNLRERITPCSFIKQWIIIQRLSEGFIHSLIPSLAFPAHTKSF